MIVKDEDVRTPGPYKEPEEEPKGLLPEIRRLAELDGRLSMLYAVSAKAALLDAVGIIDQLAVYMYHRPECPANQAHACTCGAAELRMKIWGSTDRPAPEPSYKLNSEAHRRKHKKRKELPDWPIGLLVDVWKDDLTVLRTTTRSKPAHLGGADGPMVVWCEGIVGAYSINHVYPVEHRP
jgi:hypothetical protein